MNKLLSLAAAAVALTTSAHAAAPGLYSGNWPVTVSRSQSFNGPHCLMLTDDGSAGFPHSGSATLPGTEPGEFQVIGHTLLVTLGVVGSGEEVATDIFSAPARDGIFGEGVWGYVQGGTNDSGRAVFGNNGGCRQ
jgi:hypothetical protein